MIITREKLYQGKYVDLRSYEVENAIRKNRKITVYYHHKKMTLLPKDLKLKKILEWICGN